MLIALINDDAVVKIADHREIFPNTSFSTKGPSDQFLAENSCMKVNMSVSYDKSTQKLVPCEAYVDGDVVRTTRIEDKTEADIGADIASLGAKVRRRRNELLAETDWLVIKSIELGTTMDSDWTTYRQALRDITDTYPTFDDVVWPVNPDADSDSMVGLE